MSLSSSKQKDEACSDSTVMNIDDHDVRCLNVPVAQGDSNFGHHRVLDCMRPVGSGQAMT